MHENAAPIRLHWESVTVQIDGTPVAGPLRLVALVLWLRNEPPPGVAIFAANGSAIVDPLAVNWDRFPLEQAMNLVGRTGRLEARTSGTRRKVTTGGR